MSRPLRLVVGLLVAVIGVGVATYWWKNPEKTALDAAVRASAPGKFVALSQGVTHYVEDGPDTGRVVILAHGASVPLYIWDSTAVGLSNAGFRVIRYDRFGVGLSDRPDAAYDSTMFVKQLDELADSLKLTKFDLMGQMAYRGLGRALRGTRTAAEHADYMALYDGAAKTNVPVLLIWGKQDPVVPFAYSDSVRGKIPAADFFPVDPSGHLPHLEQSALVRTKMLEFLSAHR